MPNRELIESVLAYLEENKSKKFKLTELIEQFNLNHDKAMEILGILEREYNLKISYKF